MITGVTVLQHRIFVGLFAENNVLISEPLAERVETGGAANNRWADRRRGQQVLHGHQHGERPLNWCRGAGAAADDWGVSVSPLMINNNGWFYTFL